MKTVFLSHRTADTAAATRVAEVLQDAGHIVRFDDWDVRVGDSIIGFMNDAMASDALVLCLSDKGDGPFMRREWQAYLHSMLQRGERRILPIRLTGGDLPPILADLLLADAVADFDGAMAAVLEALR
ncbi:MAG: hypothetical protein AMXMBFR64_36620 [Myxococcales bacterium]